MRLFSKVLPLLLASATVSFAQTGFTTRTFPAASDSVLRVADFNHSGKPSLLSYSPGNDFGYIYLNDGSGGFQPVVLLPATNSGSTYYAQPADLQGNGFPDIVVCTVAQGRSGNGYDLVVYNNDGTGHFTVGQQQYLPNGCSALAVGDVNLDGHLDVVVASDTAYAATDPTNNVFETFYGNGTNTLSTTPVIQQHVNLDNLSAGSSFTNCGVVDIMGGNFFLDNNFSLIANTICAGTGQSSPANQGTTFLGHGDGKGAFTFNSSHTENEYFDYGQTVDVLKNGRPDATFLGVRTGYQPDDLWYAQNNGGGSFTYNNLTTAIAAGGGPAPILFSGNAVADLTLDGRNDIAALYSTQTPNSTSQYVGPYVSILAGSGSGTFSESQHFLVDKNAIGIGGIATGDFNGDGKPDLAVIVFEGGYPNYAATLYVYTNTASAPTGGACIAPTTANTNIICSPAKGSTTTDTVTVTAASNVTGFTLNRLYLDNKSVYQTTSQTINTPLTVSTGSHTLVLVSYNNLGQAFSYSSTFTAGTGGGSGCLPSAPGQVNICQPVQGSSNSSPVTFTAGAIASSGNITALRFYVDNNAVFTVNNPGNTASFQTSQSAAVSGGTHRLVVVAYESTGAALSSSENFTVTANPYCYPASAGAEICSPVANSTVNSPVSVTAGATAGSGYITALSIYVDNQQVGLVTNPYQNKSFATTQSVPMKAGTHNLVVVGYQSTGGSVSARETITVP